MPRALIVDDEYALGEVLRDLLGEEGYGVALAHDGIEGLRSFDAEPPDLVITDVMMPRMTGKEMVAKLRARPNGRRVPVIVMSSGGMTISDMLTPEFGPVVFLRKPFEFSDLIKAIAEVQSRAERLQ